jgi:hypothetical protein
MKEEETFEMWKEMVRAFSKQLMDEDNDFKRKFQEFAHSKYVMEAMVRPFFGDNDEAYDYWLICVNGAIELSNN